MINKSKSATKSTLTFHETDVFRQMVTIIGTHKFIFDVWGDTVNTASRMESHGTNNEINVSLATYLRLRDKFTFQPCGIIDLTGKGPMEAYFLRGRRA